MTMAKIESFSKKQLKLLTWWYPESRDSGYDAIICDGAVRSGKTVCMSLSFVLWAFARFDGGDLQSVEKLFALFAEMF